MDIFILTSVTNLETGYLLIWFLILFLCLIKDKVSNEVCQDISSLVSLLMLIISPAGMSFYTHHFICSNRSFCQEFKFHHVLLPECCGKSVYFSRFYLLFCSQGNKNVPTDPEKDYHITWPQSPWEKLLYKKTFGKPCFWQNKAIIPGSFHSLCTQFCWNSLNINFLLRLKETYPIPPFPSNANLKIQYGIFSLPI